MRFPSLRINLTLAAALMVPLSGSMVSAEPPVITNVWLAPGGIALSGTGGSNSATYHLLATPDLAASITNWPAVQTNQFDANGNFILTNAIQSGTAEFFSLKMLPPAGPAQPDFSLVGYATVNWTPTGGAGGSTQTVSTASAFVSAILLNSPAVVRVQGTLNVGSVSTKANKTIIGVDANAGLVGTLNISGTTVSNVIVRNLNLSSTSGDGISIINGAHHVWVDHCTFGDCADGQCDITKTADFVTVSWCKFNYTADSGHNFSMLIGADDGDTGDRGKLNVTLHHNWWSTLVVERMPRARFGNVHSFNNYFNAPGNNYCARAAIESELLIENNQFEFIDSPYEKYVTTGTNGLIRAVGNATISCTGVQSFNDTVFTPPYSYSLQTPAAAKADVIAGAGVGIIAP